MRRLAIELRRLFKDHLYFTLPNTHITDHYFVIKDLLKHLTEVLSLPSSP